MLFSIRPFAVLLTCVAVAHAFKFSFSAPTECDNLNVTWTGGTAPYYMYLIPIFGKPQNISIPASAYSSGKGSFQTRLPFPKGSQFLASMADATGFNAGGVSAALTVGASHGGSCNTTLTPDFFFDANSALVQCSPYTFTNYADAILPVTIFAIVPGGTVFQIANQGSSVSWTANITSGTELVFTIVDSVGRQGGSSDLLTVGKSQDSSCILSSGIAAKVTANAPSVTRTATPVPKPTSYASSMTSFASSAPISTSSNTSTSGGGGSHTALIAGTLAGLGVALAVIGSLGCFCWQQRRRNKWQPGARNSMRPRSRSVDLFHAEQSSSSLSQYGTGAGTLHALAGTSSDAFAISNQTSRAHETSPFADPHLEGATLEPFPLSAVPTPRTAEFQTGGSRVSSGTSAGMTASHRSKAALAGVRSNVEQPRVYMHQDFEDAVLQEDGDLIELPPQYSASRKPIRTIPSPSDSASAYTTSERSPLADPLAARDEHPVDPFSPLHPRS